MWDNRLHRPRRRQERITVESLCSEITAERERQALVIDLAEAGLRLQRPLYGSIPDRKVQVEFEIPGYDDLIWASGEICFDQLWPVQGIGIVRTSGVRLVQAAQRHLRLLREYVTETRRLMERALDRREVDDWLQRASSFTRG